MDGIGRVFSGVSGIGKSTMAEIWRNIGAQVINDDRLIIRIVKDGSIVMFNTPMTYSDSYKSTPLNHLYLPFHSKEKCLENYLLLVFSTVTKKKISFTI
jgi:dephospho-CoA kinase